MSKLGDFPALGAGEEKKVQAQKPQSTPTNGTEEAKAASSGTDKPKAKLKLGSKTFAARNFTPKKKEFINYYIPHEEPSIKETEYFPTLGGGPVEEPKETESQQKHNEFLQEHEVFKQYIGLLPRDLWFVPNEMIDAAGYPIMANLPDLYIYMWNTYNMFFNPDGTWNTLTTNAETVRSTLGALWTHAEWRDRVLEEEQIAMEKYERELAEWERENADYYDDDDGMGLDDNFQQKKKNKKGKKTRKKKPMPPPKPKGLEDYKRFQRDKDDPVIAKPKTGFKEPGEIALEKPLVEVDESRVPSSLVFIGHVDVGKSTICGNLMLMSGMIDQRTVENYKQEAKEKNRDSWWLAYVMDISDDEKSKGKTVEVGRASLETPGRRYTIFDAPGHKNYVPDMIMGAAMSDLAALVISARKGEYESGFERDGQTREHAQLARSLGVDRLIVIVNKMDESSVEWSEERYQEIVSGITPFLTESCGFELENLTFIPISGLTGENIDKISDKSPWYTGPTLLECLDSVELPEKDPQGPIRVPVIDKMKDRGIVAFGKVESGTIEIGTRLTVMPNDRHCQVTEILNCKQEFVKYAATRENMQIKVRMIDDENLINRGDVLCTFYAPSPITELFEAELQVLELLPHRQILTPGYKSMMHLHTIGDEIVVKSLKGIYEQDGSGKEYLNRKAKYAKSGSKCLVTITTRIPVSLEKYEFIEHMGRFTLRDEGKTIAIGKVLRYKPTVLTSAEGANPLEEAKDARGSGAEAEDSKENQ